MPIPLIGEYHLPVQTVVNPAILVADDVGCLSTENWSTSTMTGTAANVRYNWIASGVSHITVLPS